MAVIGGETAAGGVKATVIAATTGHTADQVSTGPGRLHGVIVGSAAANAVVTIYDSSAASNAIAVLTMSSAATVTPIGLDFKGARFERLSVGTAAAVTVTVLWS